MKKILLIGTGGTIASVSTPDGLTPSIDASEMLDYVKDAASEYDITPLQLFNIDSTNMESDHWLAIARAIEDHYEDFDGFVLCHGTDTMAYTAAALSYLIQHSSKPIVMTGAQKPINLDNTDARTNLMDSLRFAADPRAHDVHLVFQGSVIRGTRIQKERTKSYNAFVSVNYPLVASIQDRHLFYYIDDKEASTHPVLFSHAMDPSVGLIKLIPMLRAETLYTIGAQYKALIIESFGVGGLPNYQSGSMMETVERLIDEGHIIVMTTQVPYEGSDMSIYAVGKRAKEELDLWEAYDMTLPSAVTKLMWILAQNETRERAERLFHHTVNTDTLWH